MNAVTSSRSSAGAFSLANMLTYGRIVAVPVVVGLMFAAEILQSGLMLRWVALAVFIVAAITDFLDGYIARSWGQQSNFGRMLDPIADKLLVSACLLMLAADGTIRGWSLWAAIVILCREILVSGLREYLAELRVSVPVTRLAKHKTTLQLVAIGFLICGAAGDTVLPQWVLDTRFMVGDEIIPAANSVGLTLLWVSALITLYTGWDYFRAGVHHLIED
ncbi:MAG TPA: CDP-diacylglycerol--glycerol-3-phosphate 3-phosphatidyltransferase [Xanthobacteraceae bacterium]|nr:CDP-diacylglycerol--glycerol-3-phosphate 3-phosphatidyltransferase [Xanthobacteraceae bacterium]